MFTNKSQSDHIVKLPSLNGTMGTIKSDVKGLLYIFHTSV